MSQHESMGTVSFAEVIQKLRCPKNVLLPPVRTEVVRNLTSLPFAFPYRPMQKNYFVNCPGRLSFLCPPGMAMRNWRRGAEDRSAVPPRVWPRSGARMPRRPPTAGPPNPVNVKPAADPALPWAPVGRARHPALDARVAPAQDSVTAIPSP